eukprot:4931417-Prymnesium_polylepis.1
MAKTDAKILESILSCGLRAAFRVVHAAAFLVHERWTNLIASSTLRTQNPNKCTPYLRAIST